jgi:hypothetical protein
VLVKDTEEFIVQHVEGMDGWHLRLSKVNRHIMLNVHTIVAVNYITPFQLEIPIVQPVQLKIVVKEHILLM